MHHGRQEDVDDRARLRSRERLGADADDLEKVVAHLKGAAHGHRIPAEASRPIVVRKYGVEIRVRFCVVISGEQAA